MILMSVLSVLNALPIRQVVINIKRQWNKTFIKTCSLLLIFSCPLLAESSGMEYLNGANYSQVRPTDKVGLSMSSGGNSQSEYQMSLLTPYSSVLSADFSQGNILQMAYVKSFTNLFTGIRMTFGQTRGIEQRDSQGRLLGTDNFSQLKLETGVGYRLGRNTVSLNSQYFRQKLSDKALWNLAFSPVYTRRSKSDNYYTILFKNLLLVNNENNPITIDRFIGLGYTGLRSKWLYANSLKIDQYLDIYYSLGTVYQLRPETKISFAYMNKIENKGLDFDNQGGFSGNFKYSINFYETIQTGISYDLEKTSIQYLAGFHNELGVKHEILLYYSPENK